EDGEPLRQIFDNSVAEARLMAERNPSLLFELRRRLIERGELDDMEAMARGELLTDEGETANTIVVVSDFPPELMGTSDDVGGYNASRKQTMLRIVTHEPDGKVSITTQSLDRSDRQALEGIYTSLGKQVEPGELLGQRINLSLSTKQQRKLADNLTRVYDNGLAYHLGGKWHAGILKNKQHKDVDAYEFAAKQNDLVDYFTQCKLADSRATEKMRYKMAATANARYERKVGRLKEEPAFTPGKLTARSVVSQRSVVAGQGLLREMDREGGRAAKRGQGFSGCGVTAEADEDNPLSTKNQLETSGYGNKSGSSKSDKETMNCVNCPKCRTYHETLKAERGVFRCKNKQCGYTAKAG
ncbi:MAG TPA: hypothetical protein VLG27_04750, partial [Candidatus Saccharimonadia bacterium]|nr:hypothetical protein [Candidatus Saccharimonadia bacterium]